MELKSEYKQSDVGLTPPSWKVVQLADIANIKTGGRNNQDKVADGNYPFFVRSETIERINTYSHECEAILVPGEGRIGQIFHYVNGRFDVHQRVYAITQFRDDVSARFLHLYMMRYFGKWAMQNTVKATVDSLRLPTFQTFLIALPPLREQRAIAEALSDADALLDGLDRLIAKKRDLKQATMQQLLTGKTRLPGFSGEWEVKRLGDHVTFLRNGVNSRAELLTEGSIRYLHYGDIHAAVNSYMTPAALPCLPESKASRLDRLRDGDVVFADASEDIAGVCKSVEIAGANNHEVVAGLHTITARFDKSVLADGFKGLLQHCPLFSRHLRRLAAGTKVYATNRSHIATVEMPLPKPDEQIAISEVLSDMDAELEALQARRNKVQSLKHAMMQELLTGKTRLVAPEAAHA